MAKRPKEQGFSFVGYDRKHYQTTEAYTRAVDELFNRATVEITNMVNGINVDPDKPFAFADYPSTMKRVQAIIDELTSRVTAVVQTGSRKQWLYASKKCDAFIAHIRATSRLRKGQLQRMQERNLQALDTFQGRKVQGLNLSQRVWKYTNQYKQQLETCLDVGLGEGRSNQQLAHDVKKNLQNPDRLFRRVRDKRGNLQLSKAAQAYHPGTGVYRSATKNAQRLTRSEINMAYRESDYQRWQELDFVVGFEVKRTNSEGQMTTDKQGNRKRVPCKLCDRLAGKYPKTFKFVGWHPQCMCYVVPILADYEDERENRRSRLQAALNGTEYVRKPPRNMVTDVPQGFKDWVAERIEKERQDAQAGNKHVGSTPYFIRDNFKHGSLQAGLKDEITDAVKVLEGIEQAAQAVHVILSGADLDEWRNGEFYETLMKREYPELKDRKLYELLTDKERDELLKLSATGDRTATEDLVVEMMRRARERVGSGVLSAMEHADYFGLYTFKTALYAALDSGDDNAVKQAVAAIETEYQRIFDELLAFKTDAKSVIAEAKSNNINAEKLEKVLSDTQNEQWGRPATWSFARRILSEIKLLLQKRNNKLYDSIQDIKSNNNIKRVEVQRFADGATPNEDEIIRRVGGGDNTNGSCASVALAYIGNKCGFDVLDFRGGDSLSKFSKTSTLTKIADSVGGKVVRHTDDYKKARILLSIAKEGREYYFSLAQHVAIIRRKKTHFEYLELQSPASNGWKRLDDGVFRDRFGAQHSYRIGGTKIEFDDCIIDIELLMKEPGFRELLAYLNTNDADQQKGAGGTIK